MIRILEGDCREVMRTLDAASIDAIVCDPPYELGFMGKAWDATGIANDVELWRAALRVLKPGGHLLAFSGTRTYHRMVCAIEDAGFEIRDQIGWLYGSGFPKSLDVSKAIDKVRSEDLAPLRVVCRGIRAAMDARGLKSRDLVQHFGGCDPRLVDHWAARDTDSQPSLPTWSQWETLRALLPEIGAFDAEAWRLDGRKGTPSEDYASRPDADYATGVGMRESWTDGTGWNGKASKGGDPVRDAARQWQGWGTALKPAWEPIVLARKPLVGTVAANVLQHGTGALNIDGCRVAGDESTVRAINVSHGLMHGDAPRTIPTVGGSVAGRWPANIIHDGSDEVLAAFPQTTAPGRFPANSGGIGTASGIYGKARGRDQDERAVDDGKGSAARFFYTAKANGSDRNDGGQRVTGADRNHHPTVKPTDLMRYLCRLVTPPGGTVLDPFTGSGSTLKAAELEGFSAIGIELDPAYIEIARRRIASDAPLFAEVA